MLLLALAILCAAPPASAALRVGQDSVSVKFRLSARQLLVELPRATPLGSRIRAGCGRSGLSGRRAAFTSRIFRGPRRLRFRLPQDVSSTAEWCAFETEKSNVDARRLPHGAAALRPLLARPPKHLRSGPGIREAVTTDTDGEAYGGYAGDDGDARFLLDGRILTVRLRRASRRSELVRLVCVAGSRPGEERLLGHRAVVLPAGKRVVTADLEGLAEPQAAACLIEGALDSAGDIVGAAFK